MMSDSPVAVVTGGGGPNIGRAVSLTLACRGAHVFILDKDIEAGETTVETIRSEGETATFLHCDVTDVTAVEAAIDSIVAETGRIDTLVNNAGGASGLRLESTTESEFDYNIETNLKSAFFTTKVALPHLRTTEHASVVGERVPVRPDSGSSSEWCSTRSLPTTLHPEAHQSLSVPRRPARQRLRSM